MTAAGGLEALVWCLTDPAVGASAHMRGAQQLVVELQNLQSSELDASVARRLAEAQQRAALLLRAVSDERRGRLDLAGRAARRLPPGARPGGSLRGVVLAGADLRAAPLRGADLAGAVLRDADLRGADLLGTRLDGADIGGADLTDAMFLTDAQVTAAVGDSRTLLPTRLDRPTSWA